MMADTEPSTEALFDPSLKKKKKKKATKKRVEEPQEEEISQENKPETQDETTSQEPRAKEDQQNGDETIDKGQEDVETADAFTGKKKKKTPKVATTSAESYEDSDRDYEYNELLERVFQMLSENNPDLAKSKKKSIQIKPPEVLREGTKKTVWANYQEICDMMHRQSDHVLAYARAELGTSISVDGNQRLVIKGRFQPKQIESVVRHYVHEYVSCRTCKSPDTLLKKENRLYFIKCQACGSTRSVATIKQGFVAQVDKRKKIM
jgi:translation initiation factor 2 subunit 2